MKPAVEYSPAQARRPPDVNCHDKGTGSGDVDLWLHCDAGVVRAYDAENWVAFRAAEFVRTRVRGGATLICNEAIQDVPGRQPTLSLASPNSLLNTGLRFALQDDFTIVGESESGAPAVAVARLHRPDLTLVHAELGGDLIDTIRTICEEQLSSVVVLSPTAELDEALLIATLRAGAVGVLPVRMQADRLPATLRGVLRGEAALPRSYVSVLLNEFRARPSRTVRLASGRLVRLTPREWEILNLLREGDSTSAIAKNLGVAHVTVRTHIATLRRKLHASSRGELQSIELSA